MGIVCLQLTYVLMLFMVAARVNEIDGKNIGKSSEKSNEKCERAGILPHPSDCRTFRVCVKNGTSLKLAGVWTCKPDTVFSAKDGTCVSETKANRCATTARSPIDDPYLIPAPLPQHTQCRNPGVNCLGCSTLLLCNMNLDGTPTPILSFNCQNNGGASFCDAYQGTCVSESYACSHSRIPPGHSGHPGQRPPFVCRSRGLFADPELHDCSGYIVCLRPGGSPIRRLCGGNTRFSNTFQTCVSTLLAPPECFQQPPPPAFQCPYEGNFADTSSRDCTRYYECKSFGARGRQLVPVSRTCNFGEAFNDGAGRCMNSYFVRCNGVNPDVNYDGPVEEMSACPSRDGAFADPNSPGDCASYIVCVNGCIVDRGRCPPGYVFVPSPDGRVSCSPTDYSPDCGQNSRSRQRSFFF